MSIETDPRRVAILTRGRQFANEQIALFTRAVYSRNDAQTYDKWLDLPLGQQLSEDDLTALDTRRKMYMILQRAQDEVQALWADPSKTAEDWVDPSTDTSMYVRPAIYANGFSLLRSTDSYANPIWITSLDYGKLTGAPVLATVATTGSYNDLSNKPTIPSGQVNSDWNAASGVAQILNKPTLALVATSGTYSDLSGKPSIPAAQINSDWNSVSGVSQILNKPTFATVATTGAYADLSGRPSLATVATTGAYSDLTGKPTIPAAQVNSDWNSVSGVSQILNKPTLSAVATTGAYADLSGKPTLGTAAATNSTDYATAAQGAKADTALQPTSSISSTTGVNTNTQTAIDAKVQNSLSASTTIAPSATAVNTGLSGKQNTITTGTTAQYFRGDLSLATFPTNLSSFTNGPGYITGISSGDVTTALGYTPYNGTTNPNGYITTAGARSAISLTTTGTGVATFSQISGVLNIPTPVLSSGTVTSVGLSSTDFAVSGSPVTVSGSITANLNTVGTAGTYSGVTTDTKGRVTAGTTRAFNNAPARTIQTVAAAANGWQIDATRDALVSYSVTINTSSTLAGGAAGSVLIEICPTNSATAANWTEVARTGDGQLNGLIVGLSLNQLGGGAMSVVVPGGYYVRLRSVIAVGTPTFGFASGQEVKL